MALDMRKLFEALMRFLEVRPDGTAKSFATKVVEKGLGTEENAQQFLVALGGVLLDAGFTDASTWEAMKTHLEAVGLERFKSVTRAVFSRTVSTPAFADLVIEQELAVLDVELSKLETKRGLLEQGIAWVKQNMPRSQAKLAVLEALTSGQLHVVAGPLSHFARVRDQKRVIKEQ